MWDVLPVPTLCFITFIQKKNYDHYCPVHVSNYLQYGPDPLTVRNQYVVTGWPHHKASEREKVRGQG